MQKKKLPSNFISDPDLLVGFSEDVSGEVMVPEYLVRPKSVEEISEVLEYCNIESIAVTPAGAQTNDTASSLSKQGVCLSTASLNSIIEVNPDEGYAIAEPGILLGELKAALAVENMFYPPDPTSQNEASLGGTVATNASGAQSYLYGPTANHILELEVVLPGGKRTWVKNSLLTKSAIGPCPLNNLAQFWVGSEGIFGVISKVKIRAERNIPQSLSIVAFFKTLQELVTSVLLLKQNSYALSPSALEFLDATCLKLLREEKRFSIPQNAGAALIIDQEFAENNKEVLVESWTEFLEKVGALIADSIVAESSAEKASLKSMRHFVPSKLNECGLEARKAGGRKISTDWAVPLSKLAEIIERGEKLSLEHGFEPERVYRYAHIGDGHPHYNFIALNAEERVRAETLRREFCKLAVSLGGTVAGEHGIGKLRKDLLALEAPSLKLRLMRALKKELDPNSIMAPGNIIS